MVAKDAQECEDNKSYMICDNMSSKTEIFDKYICKYEKKNNKMRYTFSPGGFLIHSGKGEMAVKKSTQCDFAVSEITVIRNDSKKNLQNPELAVIKF